LANLQYISIVRLFLHCDIDIDAPLQLSRIRKQIIAEFAIATDGFISIDEYSYNKNDVLEELDKVDFEERFATHLIIWKRKQILQLLEKDSIDMDTIGQEMNDYRKNEKFIAFVSPYLKTSFNNMCRSLLYPPKLGILGVFLKMQQFIVAQDTEEAFSSVKKYLSEQDRLFRNTTSQNYHLNRNELLPWRSGDFSSFLNLLPDSLYELKEDIVIHLINTSVSTQNTYSADASAYSAEMVKLVGIDAEHKKLILANNNVFNGSSNIGTSSGGTSYWWILWLTIALVRLVGMGGC
jgi:hypothetical protein